MINSVMLDLETLGVNPNAPVIAVGACGFNTDTFKVYEDYAFYEVIDLTDSLTHGATPDGSTIQWWMTQPDEVRKAITRPGISEGRVLASFHDWFNLLPQPGKLTVWGNGADFDNIILANAFRRHKMAQPWGPYNGRCFRTLKGLCKSVEAGRGISRHVEAAETPVIKHHAFDDAVAQAHAACNILQYLQEVK